MELPRKSVNASLPMPCTASGPAHVASLVLPDAVMRRSGPAKTIPPPPAVSLNINVNPMSRAAASAAAASATGVVVPRDTGTPAAETRLRARILSPMASMASGDGPTQASPAPRTRAAKDASSARNPYPGWTACAPETRAASRTASTLR